MAATKLSSAISEIRYYTNYSDPAAPVIKLGAIAEALTDKTLVLALVGRAALTAAELATVSGHNRAELEDVWGTLTKAFKSAWDQRPQFNDGPVGAAGMMLKYLAEKHSMSLHFETPQPLSIPKRVAEKVQRTPKSLGNSVLSLLEARLAPPKPAPRQAAHRAPRRQRPVELNVRLCRIKNVRSFIDEIPLDHPTTNPIQPSCDFLCHLAEQEMTEAAE